MLSLHHVPDPGSAFPELARVVRDFVWIAEPLPEGEFFELLRPVDDETEVRAKAQAAISAQTSSPRRDRRVRRDAASRRLRGAARPVLAADPTRAARFAEVEPDLRRGFRPGDYVVPMRADLLRVTSR